MRKRAFRKNFRKLPANLERQAPAEGVPREIIPLRYGPVRALAVVTALDSMSYTVLLAAIPLWQVQAGQPASVAGLYTVAMLSATLVTQPAVSKLIERIGALQAMVGGLVALGLPSPLFIISHRPEYDIALSLLRGAGFGIVTVVCGILGATVVPRERHGESVGVTGAAASLASLASLPLGVALTHAGHFWVAACLGISPIIGAYPALVVNRAPRRSLQPNASLRQRPRSLRYIAGITISLFVVTMALGAVSSYLPLAEQTTRTATAGLFAMGAAALLARSLAGRLVDRRGTSVLLPLASGVAACGLWLVAGSLSVRPADAWIAVPACCVVLGAGCGAVQTATMVAAFRKVPHSDISTASAAWNFSYDIGTALGVSVMSLCTMARLGISGGFCVIGLAILVTVPVGKSSGRTRRPDYRGSKHCEESR